MSIDPQPVIAAHVPVPDPAELPWWERRRQRAVQFLEQRVHTLSSYDAALYLRVNGLPRGPLANQVMWAVSRSMLHGEAWVALALAMWAFGSAGPSGALAGVVAPLWLATLVVNYPVKQIFRRGRPFVHLVDAVVVGRRPADHSFPSGHTAGAFGGAWLIAELYPGAAPWLYGFAALVGFSRVYLGVHYPSDVVIGAGVGIALSAAARTLVAAL